MGDALEGIRVVDASIGIAGSVAGMFFADFGAEVVKVGDPLRAHPGSAVWDRGKRRVHEDAVPALLAAADVHIADAEPAHGHPGLVTLVTTPYTDRTPWAGGGESEGLLAALMGTSLRQASFEGGPIDTVSPVLCTIQGIWGAACAVAALVEREGSGIGQTVTVGGAHGALVASAAAFTFRPDRPGTPRHIGGPGGRIPFFRTYRCSDGEWLFLAALTPRFTKMAFEVLGVPDLPDDPRLEGRGRAGLLSPEHAGWVIERIARAFETAPRDEWLDRLKAAGCPAGPVLGRDDWLDHPQVDAIGMRVEVDDPERGTVVMPGVPIGLSGAPGAVRGPAAVDTEPPHWEPRDTRDPEAGPKDGPLDGIRVLDLGAIIAGPFAASLLAELGADVVKVEPLRGDSFRGPGFAAYNKGQRGIALDLQAPEGRDAFLDLVAASDVVVDNYRPGVLARLGLTWEELRSRNPDVISASVTGFGHGGPLSDEAGFDPVLQAMSGLMSAQGGDSDPVLSSVPVSDVTSAATLAFGVVLALLDRARTGRPHRVTTSLAAAVTIAQAGELVRFPGRPPPRVGGRDHRGPDPLDRYHEAADGWLRIQASHLSDAPERFANAGDRGSDVAAWISTLSRDEAVERLTRAGIPAAPARTVSDLAGADDLIDSGVLRPDPRPGREHGWTAGRHARFSRTQRSGTLVAPDLGQHTREVFAEIGYPPDDVAALLHSDAAAASD